MSFLECWTALHVLRESESHKSMPRIFSSACMLAYSPWRLNLLM